MLGYAGAADGLGQASCSRFAAEVTYAGCETQRGGQRAGQAPCSVLREERLAVRFITKSLNDYTEIPIVVSF